MKRVVVEMPNGIQVKNICNAGLIVSVKEHSGSRLKTPTS